MSVSKAGKPLIDPVHLINPQVALAPSSDPMLDKCLDEKDSQVSGKKIVCFIGPPHALEIYSNKVAFEESCNNESDIEEEQQRPSGAPLVGQQSPQFDPWALPELAVDTGPEWKELRCGERVKQVVFGYMLKLLGLVTLLYLFICSLGILSSSFRLLGGRTAGKVFQDSELLRNPITGLMIGVLATVLLQSSSTSTSIVVSMVASSIMDVPTAIPVIMGANIGTSMTNTLVSVAHSNQRAEFRRAFAGATVHDMFNWLCVICLLPLECGTRFLYRLTFLIINTMNLTGNKQKSPKLLKVLTEPLTSLVIQLDKKKIKALALNQLNNSEEFSLIKRICSQSKDAFTGNLTSGNYTESPVQLNYTATRCRHIFAYTSLSDTTVGVILLCGSLVVLVSCLVLIVKLLHSMLKGQIASAIRKTINNDLPGCFSFLTGYVAILVGAIMTILVQSSSVFTSALTPLVGIGVLTLERMYPLTLGANVGTTFTSILAALSSDQIASALQISLCHLLFNLSGIILFYVVPVTRQAPIRLAKLLGNKTAEYRWVAVVYVLLMFFVLPAAIMGLSLCGPVVFMAVSIPFAVLVVMLILVNMLQDKCPKVLPKMFRNWSFLPEWMHSLDPFDRLLTRVLNLCPFCTTGWPCCAGKEESRGKSHAVPPSRSESRKVLFRASPGTSNAGSVASRLASRSNSPSRFRNRDITNV